MYILECANGAYYTGSTNNLELRLQQHENGEGANFTKKYLPVKLVYFEEFQRIDEAFYREKQVQGWSRKKKEALIKGEFKKLPQLSKIIHSMALRQAQCPISLPKKSRWLSKYRWLSLLKPPFITIQTCPKMNKINKSFFKDVREILSRARIQAYAAVNSAMVETYWLIGKRIVEEEQQGLERAAYGEKLLQALSNELSAEFGKGFSYANLRNFRQFYLTYPNPEICYALRSRLRC